ncbi:MAG: pyridoxal phosphate-dependent aminotransferase [Chloroflexota bacterium]|nr:pyridoxal phosphate-dependent aminotransferase [Chloroflexota bacterium]
MTGQSRSKTKKRTSQRVDSVAGAGFSKFLSLLHSLPKEGLISLSVGEPDVGTPQHICGAAIEALEEGWTKYTPSSGFPELRQAIAEDLQKRYGISYNPETEIILSVGVSEALDLTFRATVDPGDEVLLPDPHYLCYPSCISLAGGVPVPVPTRFEDEFKLEAEEIESRLTSRTKLILFGNAANPTGTEMGRDDLAGIASLAERHDLLVISDEIYSKFTYGVEHTCFATLPGMKERTILLDGFSKRYAMTGWRLGYAAGPADIISAMGNIHQHTMLCPPSVAQMAAIAGLKGGDADVERTVAEYDRRRKVMMEGLNKIGLKACEPKGAFYFFPSIQTTGMSSEEFAEKLLTEEKVMVMPGNLFGQCGEGFVRCCYATSMANIEEALRRMASFVKRHSS